jgi:hypothetical protein
MKSTRVGLVSKSSLIARIALFAVALMSSWSAMATSPNVVISQAYGGGGNSGSVYKNDFIELFNRSSAPINLAGWSVQYASSAGTSWQVTTLSNTIPAYGYFLVQQAAGTGGTTSLPTPDVTGSIAMSGTAFKVAVCNTTTALSGANPIGSAQLVDFVGAGTGVTNYEGTGPAPAPSNANSVMRASNGCTDTDNNASDFTAVAANPRNTSSPLNNCGDTLTGFIRVETKADGTGVVVPAQNIVAGSSITVYAISRDANTNFVSNVAADSWSLTKNGAVAASDLVPSGDLKSAVFTAHGAGTASITANSSTATSVSSGNITVTGGTPTQVLVETDADGSGTVVPAETVVAGHGVTMYAIRRDVYSNFVDNVAASSWTLPIKTGAVATSDLVISPDLKSATFTGNGQGTATVRATSAALTAVDSGLLTVTSLPPATVVISQVYGAGGNSGAVLQSDYVELFNRSANPVSLSGFSIQYASSVGAFQSGTSAALPSVSIAPYSYYLVQLFTTNTAGSPLSITPDFVATNINLSGTAGKIALVNTTNAIGTITWPDVRVLDLVAYGASSPSEGSGPAPTLSASTAAFRNNNGCTDTDNNATDFATGSPNPRNASSGQNICSSQTPPTITGIGNQSADSATTIGPISFDVNDAQTAAGSLVVTAVSDNTTLLPNNAITFGGSGIVRNVTLNPVSGQTGTAHVTVTVTDSDNMTASTSFYVFVGNGPQLGILFTENFDQYADGTALSFDQSSPWFHSSGTNYELIVSNKAAQVSLYLTNSEDIYATFATGPFTATSGDVLFIGFTLTQTALPGVNGDYFLHLRDANGTNFVAKVFASTGNAAAGKFRLGVSNRANNPPNVQFPLDLSLNTTYNVVVRYKVSVGSSTIWVNPSSPNDVGATATDSLTPFDITGIGIREAGSPTTPTTSGSQVLDNLIVSTSMSDVTTFPVAAPAITATRSGNSIQLSWPTANNSGYVLQTAGTVNATSWTTVGGVTTSGSNYTVTIPISGTQAYFRLKQ